MALNNLTKVQTLGIGSNIEVVGVITTGQFKSGTSNLHSSGVELTNLNVSGIATIGGNVSIGGTLTYQDVTNIDSVGLITARAGVNVSGGQLDVGSNIKLGNAGVITATSFVGSGANLTSLPSQLTLSNNADNRVITGGSGTNLNGEANLTFNGTTFQVTGEGYVTGNLSIGEASPDRKLHVKSGANNNDGAFRVESSSGNIMDMGTDSTGHFLNCVNADPFKIKFAGTERLRITSAGKLGVGNASPTFLLDVKGATTDTLRISNSNETGHGSHDAKIVAGGSNYHNMRFEASTYKFITFDGSNTYERFLIQHNGEFQLKPPGNAACDLAFKLNNSNDSRIKFYDSGGTYRGAFGFTEYANNTDYPNFHDSFYLLTDPSSNGSLTTAMRINHNGCFILPKQPCFSVAMSSNYSTATTHTANFDTERFDQGNNFNTGSNGVFTAPVTGKYYMHAAIQTQAGGTASQVHLMGVAFLVNGSVQVSKGSGDQYLGRDTGHYITVHCIRILDLAQNDTVQVYIQLHGTVAIEGSGGSDRCNWQGYLMA